MKKKKLHSIIKKSVCFFVSSLIVLVPLIGIPFTVSAADTSSVVASWTKVGSFDIVGAYHLIVPESSTSSYEYVVDTSRPVMRTFYGNVSMDINAGPNSADPKAPTTKAYRYFLTTPESYSPVSILQVYLKANMVFEPGSSYRITFDVTPAPGFAGWNKVYVPNIHLYTDVPRNNYQLGTHFYTSFNGVDSSFVSFCKPYTSAKDKYFDDTRYRFTYVVNFNENIESPVDFFLCISVPYYLGLSNTSLTTYVYNPIIEQVRYTYPDFSDPNLSDQERLDNAELNLVSIVRDNWDNKWFNPDYAGTYLGSNFLAAFKGVGDLLQDFYSRLPFLRSLIFFSCTLGLAGFVLNLGTSLASKFSHKRGD